MSDPYAYPVSVDELVKRYRATYTGAVYDILDEMGLPNQAVAADIKPVRSDMVLAGPAFTLKGFPDTTGEENLRGRRIEMFSAMKRVGVPVIDVRDCSFDTETAHYGELNATVGAANGAVGAVVDGGCRDTGFILRQDFPVFCRYQSPIEANMRWSYYRWQIPVSLRGALTRTVPVSPGDFLVGDLDGVVVVPRDVVIDVLEQVEALIEKENEARAGFANGEDPVEVYRRFGRL